MENADEREPDPETNAQLWADRAPRGWVRCAGCGDEGAVEDDHQCKCEHEVECTYEEWRNALIREAQEKIMDSLKVGSSFVEKTIKIVVNKQLHALVNALVAEADRRIRATDKEAMRAVTKAMDALSSATIAMTERENKWE